jgi:hypothetical protein
LHTVTETYLTPALLDLVGREIRTTTSFPITDSDIRRWAIAVYYPEPAPRLFWDAAYAAATVHGGIVAPEDLNPFAWMAQATVHTATARPAGEFALPEEMVGGEAPPTTAMVNGGLEVEYGVRMRPGDVITSTSKIGDYKEREGRLGLMLFSTMLDTWTNQQGETVKTSRNTLIRY